MNSAEPKRLAPDGRGTPDSDPIEEKTAEPSDPADQLAQEPPLLLGSTSRETWVYSRPNWGSKRLGYLRAGATVTREKQTSGRRGCSEGWYRIQPSGFVCIGVNATLDMNHPVLRVSAKRPDLMSLPYTYVMSKQPPPPFYAYLPDPEEQALIEPDLKSHLRVRVKEKDPRFTDPPPPEESPPELANRAPLPSLGFEMRKASATTLGQAKNRSGFALLSTFDHENRRFGLTTDLALIPVDRTRVVKVSTFHGSVLDDEHTLPVGFVRAKSATRYKLIQGIALAPSSRLGFREAVGLTARRRREGGQEFIETNNGDFVRADQVQVVSALEEAPTFAKGDRKWIDVSILSQALVAYEGTRPVYVTLVSTGKDGIQDPKTTHSTIQGVFPIHTKHVSVTMDGDTEGDEFDFRDVPYVQYFTEGFALHAAYWHDQFGTPRSHGCVNLSPLDAAWLFQWTTPEVPASWHAALSLRGGTLVYTHP